jgi:hypothetical protein
MMANDETVLELARAIRLYLPELLGNNPERSDEVRRLDRELAELLSEAQRGQEVDEGILDRLKLSPAVHNWAATFLQSGLPPDVAEERDRGFSPLAGRGEAVAPMKYICPEGADVVWYRRAVDQPVPQCPTHHVALEPVSSG